MQIRPRFEHWIPRRLGVNAIVLYPFILFSDSRDHVDREIVQHEMVHIRQLRSHGVLGFYARYLLEYFAARLKGRPHRQAYLEISFESEAYRLQSSTPLSHDEEREFNC